jgi:hypothetical protein
VRGSGLLGVGVFGVALPHVGIKVERLPPYPPRHPLGCISVTQPPMFAHRQRRRRGEEGEEGAETRTRGTSQRSSACQRSRQGTRTARERD